MSGDQLDLDAIEAWFEGKTQHSSLDDLSVVPEWEAVRALVAEVRRLRAVESRLGELPGQWIASTADGLGHRREHWRGADYAEGVDAGVEGCADVLRRTLAGE